jgi:hypothetical protein
MSGDDAGKITRAALKWVEDEGLLRQSILWQNKVREAFEAGAAFAQGSQATPLIPTTRDWVKCPVCGQSDMRQETDRDGNRLIFCVNLTCASNGGSYSEIACLDCARAIVELKKYLNQCEGETVVGGIRNLVQAMMSREEEIEQLNCDLAAAQPERPGPTPIFPPRVEYAHRVECPERHPVLIGEGRCTCESVAPQSAPGPQWISVEERLPVEDRPVWMFNGMCGVAVYRQIDGWWLLHGAEEVCPLPNVTYWQELPAPPGSVAPPEAERQPASKVEILTHGDKWHDVTQPKAERPQQEEK